MKIAKYLKLAKLTIIDQYTHFTEKLFSGIIIAIVLFVFIHIWQAIYAGRAEMEGYTIAQMIWYLAFAEVLVLSATAGVDDVGEEVRSGALANTLLKPWSYLTMQFTKRISIFFYGAISVGLIAFLAAFLLVGSIDINLYFIPFIIIGAILASVLDFCLVMSLGVLALWIEDTSSLQWIYEKSLFILGGMMVPLDFYPLWLKEILAYLPTTFMIYLPSKMFVRFEIDTFVSMVFGQIAWIIVIGVIMVILYKISIRKVSINGG